jgi:hypothetical protein
VADTLLLTLLVDPVEQLPTPTKYEPEKPGSTPLHESFIPNVMKSAGVTHVKASLGPFALFPVSPFANEPEEPLTHEKYIPNRISDQDDETRRLFSNDPVKAKGYIIPWRTPNMRVSSDVDVEKLPDFL